MPKRESLELPCRLLIIEDDWLISTLIEDQLAELSLEIAGWPPASRTPCA